MKKLEGKISVITGVGSGIGRSTALLFASEGAIVIGADLDEINGEKVITEIKENGEKGIFVKTDVSKSDEVKN